MKFENTTAHKITLHCNFSGTGAKNTVDVPRGCLGPNGEPTFGEGRLNGVSEEIEDGLAQKFIDANPSEFGSGELIAVAAKPKKAEEKK